MIPLSINNIQLNTCLVFHCFHSGDNPNDAVISSAICFVFAFWYSQNIAINNIQTQQDTTIIPITTIVIASFVEIVTVSWRVTGDVDGLLVVTEPSLVMNGGLDG